MSPKAIAVAGLSAIALAAGGCSGDSDAEAESPPATTTEQVETQPPAQSLVNITKLRAEFKERFGTPPNEAPWYRHITAINWANDQLEIKTTSARRGVRRERPAARGDLWGASQVGFRTTGGAH